MKVRTHITHECLYFIAAMKIVVLLVVVVTGVVGQFGAQLNLGKRLGQLSGAVNNFSPSKILPDLKVVENKISLENLFKEEWGEFLVRYCIQFVSVSTSSLENNVGYITLLNSFITIIFIVFMIKIIVNNKYRKGDERSGWK